MRWLPDMFSRSTERQGNVPEGLTTLVLAAKEDEAFRKAVLAVLSATPSRREELLQDLCAAASEKKSTSHFAGALQQLKKDEVRYQVLREIAP